MSLDGCFNTYLLNFMGDTAPEQIFLTPSSMFDAANTAVYTHTFEDCQAFHEQSNLIFNMLHSKVMEKMLQECPVVLMVAFLVTYWLFTNGDRALLMRVWHQARVARAVGYESGFTASAWDVPFLQHWPVLSALPAPAFAKAGCALPPEARTLPGLVEHSPRLVDAGCLDFSAVFSPQDLWSNWASERALSACDLFTAMNPTLRLRPAPFNRLHHHDFLNWTLQEYVTDENALDGLLLEFGVGNEAISAGMIADHSAKVWQRTGFQQPRLFGFDSFQGLPRHWGNLEKGAFGLDSSTAPVVRNAEFVVGWFNETVEPFLQGAECATAFAGQGAPRIALVHMDADLYESTLLVLELLTPYLRNGTILIFDDLFFGMQTWTGFCIASSESRVKENWDALFEVIESSWRHRWQLEVLAAPWNTDNIGSQS
mmetsp:Transcript_13757/g.26196  ORF Transcript_13757/g.26196 Transcript_13757/m.26196 type:complete len:427 (+) Transcript_13757:110-1390(+)